MVPEKRSTRQAAAAATLAVALTACTATPPAGGGTQPADPTLGSCDAGPGQAFLGQASTVELGLKMLAATGARQLRAVPPRSAMTMDFRSDRLTIELDDANTITRVSCG